MEALFVISVVFTFIIVAVGYYKVFSVDEFYIAPNPNDTTATFDIDVVTPDELDTHISQVDREIEETLEKTEILQKRSEVLQSNIDNLRHAKSLLKKKILESNDEIEVVNVFRERLESSKEVLALSERKLDKQLETMESIKPIETSGVWKLTEDFNLIEQDEKDSDITRKLVGAECLDTLIESWELSD